MYRQRKRSRRKNGTSAVRGDVYRMAGKKKKDKGVLKYISPKFRKRVKAIIRELGLELLSVKMIPEPNENEG